MGSTIIDQTLHDPSSHTEGDRSRVIDQLRIAETFTSRQGEGALAGTMSYFVRTSGCNLRCWFCDTPYASWSPEGTTQTIDEIVDHIPGDIRHAVVTGGEPLVQPAIESLCDRLMASGLHVTVETAGTIDRNLPVSLLSLSPKLRSSGPDPTRHPRWAERHERRRGPIAVMRRLIERAEQTQIKFVVSVDDATEVWDEIATCVDRLGVANEQVWIMPEATSVEALDRAEPILKPTIRRYGYQFADRRHLRWYGNRRGT